MSLHEDFTHVANAHTQSYQRLVDFLGLISGMATSNAKIKEAIEHAPKQVTRERTFAQIVLDETLDAFASVMAKTIDTSDATIDNVPHEFYLKLLRQREDESVTVADAKARLARHIEFRSKHQSSPLNSGMPTFLKLIFEEMDPSTRAGIGNAWIGVVNGFAQLMMSEQALAAQAAANEIAAGTAGEVNQRNAAWMQRNKALGISPDGLGMAGDAAGGSKKFQQAMEALKEKTLPETVKEMVDEELEKLGQLHPQSPETSKVREWLMLVASLPWNEKTDLQTDLNATEAKLNEDHYGMDKVKEAILEHVAVENHTGKSTGKTLLLIGPPGVGKTSILKSVAEATGRNYARMALGGVRDEATIRGHSRTYLGSKPGRIVETMKRAGSMNPLIALDEIDKMQGDPGAAMLEVLDPAQNHSFYDHYLDLEFDLSGVMFVATANDYTIHPALLDRMKVIQLPGYTQEEKLEIAKRHLVPQRLKENGLDDSQLAFTDDGLKALINGYTREAGVRGLMGQIDDVSRKVVVRIGKGDKAKVTVTPDNLQDIIGPPKVEKLDVTAKGNRIGVVNGLAFSAVGGSIMQIGAQIRPARDEEKSKTKDFVLKVTGNLGKVMGESTEYALTSTLSHIMDSIGGFPKGIKGHEIHAAPLEGAVPKDGPSAGAAITTALVSLLTRIPVRSNVAMTGAISQFGEVGKIGGLLEKLDGAIRDGADTVLIPKANEPDLEKVPDTIKNKLTIIPVSTIDEVLEHALTTPLHEAKLTLSSGDCGPDDTPLPDDGGDELDVGMPDQGEPINENDPDTEREKRQAVPVVQTAIATCTPF